MRTDLGRIIFLRPFCTNLTLLEGCTIIDHRHWLICLADLHRDGSTAAA